MKIEIKFKEAVFLDSSAIKSKDYILTELNIEGKPLHSTVYNDLLLKIEEIKDILYNS